MEKLLLHSKKLGLHRVADELAACMANLRRALSVDYGNEKKWRDVLLDLPPARSCDVDYQGDRVRIGSAPDMTDEERDALIQCIKALSPWRKGPFDIFGIPLDCEWASNIKWDRLKNNIAPIKGKRVLDVGCSSGYYMFRMLAHEPAMVLGIDPQLLFYYQYKILEHYAKPENIYYIPAKLEDLPDFKGYFDTVFFMGIIYHRKSPLETLAQLHSSMKKGGELVLETMILEGDGPYALFPADRYAKMRNVFFIPTIPCLESWLRRSRFGDIRVIDITKTTADEQRITPWSGVTSLDDYLDPEDSSRTVEGYPAPIRAMVIAKAM